MTATSTSTLPQTLLHRAPLAVRPTWTCMGKSTQNQPMQELVHALENGHPDIRCVDSPVSAGAVSMPPRHAARAHKHAKTWIYVIVLRAGRAGVVTRYGPELEHEFIHHPGDILVMPPGVPHGAVNLSRWRSVHAIELRVSESVHRDNHLLSRLQHVAESRRPHPLPWPVAGVLAAVRWIAAAARRVVQRRQRARSRTAGDRTVNAPAGVASPPVVPGTVPVTDSQAAEALVGEAGPGPNDAEEVSDLAERASRAGPALVRRSNGASALRGDWPIMDWSASSPPHGPGRQEPAHAGDIESASAVSAEAANAAVVIAAIDLLTTALAVLRPRLLTVTDAAGHSPGQPARAADSAAEPGVAQPGVAKPSTPDTHPPRIVTDFTGEKS